jgi:cellulose synthase (UDP-forming)
MSEAMALTSAARRTGRHRQDDLLPAPPSDEEKTSYIDRRLGYLTAAVAIGNASAIASQVALELRYSLLWLAPYTVLAFFYATLSIIANFTGESFDYDAHRRRVAEWQPSPYPDVDIYLPVCGESIDLLRNTWINVFELIQAYPGWAAAYVLDDGASGEVRTMAASFGFVYVVRPDRPWMKKSGNLRHAFAHTSSKFFVVLDADFAPRRDLLAETLPYFDDPKIAIVQTPQFFRTDRRQTWVERAAGAVQEVFYRSMQVSRDDVDASICVGTCAIYRREALAPEGGTALIEYAEDVHTGLDVRRNGWKLKYVPVVLATGTCPDNVDAFVRQQYRWCTGSTSTLLTKRLWSVPMSIRARLTYVSGFCFYVFTALAMFVGPLIPCLLLISLSEHIEPRNYLLLVPALLNGMMLYPLWHRCGYGPSTWPLAVVRGWAHALALWDYGRRNIMAWQPSGAGVKSVRRFWGGVRLWNGSTALAWLGLAGWRIYQSGLSRFWVITLFGIVYAAIITRILISPRKANG